MRRVRQSPMRAMPERRGRITRSTAPTAVPGGTPKTACRNTEIRAQTLENHVLSLLANQVFDEALLPELYRRYADFAAQKDEEGRHTLCTLSARLDHVQSGIRNIVAVVVETGSAALNEKLRELETQKAALEFEIRKSRSSSGTTCGLRDALRGVPQGKAAFANRRIALRAKGHRPVRSSRSPCFPIESRWSFAWELFISACPRKKSSCRDRQEFFQRCFSVKNLFF